MVHARLKAAGELGEEVAIGAKVFAVGDRVIFEKNQRVSEVPGETTAHPTRLSLRNGTFGTVVGLFGQPEGKPATRR